MGQLERALQHYQESIRHAESASEFYGAAQTRFNVALALFYVSRFDDAREYARTALRNFQTFGASAKDDVLKTLDLIAKIDTSSS